MKKLIDWPVCSLKKAQFKLQKVKWKVDLLVERSEELYKLHRFHKDNVTLDEWEHFMTNIQECLPILLVEPEERKTVWALLKIIEEFTSSIVYAFPEGGYVFLNYFAVIYENYASVEEYATDETVDFEMHAMALKAREILNQPDDDDLDHSIIIETRLREKLKIETEKKKQQHLLYVIYYNARFGLTEETKFYETVILTDKSVVVGWETDETLRDAQLVSVKEEKTLETLRDAQLVSVNEEKQLWQLFDLTCNKHFIGFHGSFPIGTVLTCLLDIYQQTVAFYIDGQPVDFQKRNSLISVAYQGVAYVDHDEGEKYSPLLYVNFGQVTFKHLPAQFDNLATCLREQLLKGTANQSKVNLLEEQLIDLEKPFLKHENISTNEMICLQESICDCLPILGTELKERITVWQLLDLISRMHICNDFLITKLPETRQLLLDRLNSFADEHEDWTDVEEYAIKKTVDLERRAMAVWAREISCKLEGKRFNIKSSLKKKKLRCEMEGKKQCIVLTPGNYRSAFGLTSGVHYFETVVQTKTRVVLGWSTRLRVSPQSESIDKEELLWQSFDPIDDQHLIGFNATFPLGTVLGCFLHFTHRAFAFYVDGRQVQLSENVAFSSNAYYVSARYEYTRRFEASSGKDSHLELLRSFLYFNFGQVPFKYPPSQLSTLLPSMVIQANRYALYDNARWILLVDNQVEPYFTDAKQWKVKEKMRKLFEKREVAPISVGEEYVNLWRERHFHSETYFLRWLQEMIQMPIKTESMNDWARLVEMVVEMTIEKWFNMDFYDFIVPYSKLQATEGGNLFVYRNLAILFATSMQYIAHLYMNSEYSRDIFNAMSSFLNAAFLTSHDPIIAMFALIGLRPFWVEEIMFDEEEEVSNLLYRPLINTEHIVPKMKKWKEKIERMKNCTMENAWEAGNANHERHIYPQLQLVIQHFEQKLDPSLTFSPATPTSLSLLDRWSEIKVSINRLSLRSDWQWQSARSHLAIDNRLSLESPIFFFEVTLHTSGPMRIGWATKRWQPLKGELGVDEFSIGYDGYNRCLWHQGVQLRVRQTHQWKAGDVISCLLNLASKQFVFYHNGTIIETTGEIFSAVNKKIEPTLLQKMYTVYVQPDSPQSLDTYLSTQPYNSALSLGPYQQATVNLGHTDFRFLPKYLDVWDFQMYSDHLEFHRPSKRIKVEHVTLTNSLLALDGSTITSRDVTISQVTTQPDSKASMTAHQSQSKELETFVFQQLGNPHFHQMMALMPRLVQIPLERVTAFYSDMEKRIEHSINRPTHTPFPSLPSTISTAAPAITYPQPSFNPQPLPSINNAISPQQPSNPQAQPSNLQPVPPSTGSQPTSSSFTSTLPLPPHSTFPQTSPAFYPPGPWYGHFPPPYPSPYPTPYPTPSPYYHPTVQHPYSQIPFNPNHPNQPFSPNASIQPPPSIASTSQSVNVPPGHPTPPIPSPNYQQAYPQFYQPTVYYQTSSPFVPAPVAVQDPNVPTSQPTSQPPAESPPSS